MAWVTCDCCGGRFDDSEIQQADCITCPFCQRKIGQLPACPVCGSKKYVKRISTLNRMTSIAIVGLASSKIGKQYECTYCRYRW